MNFKRLAKVLTSYLPTKLPTGMTEFDNFANDIIELAGNYADEDSMKFVIATNIQHMKQTQDRVSKQFFVRVLRKAAANQIASQVFINIKAKQLEAQKQAEATAKLAQGSSETKETQKPTSN